MNSSLFPLPPRTGGSVGCASGCHVAGREFDSGRTNTQGLKITEEKVLPLLLHQQMVDFRVLSRIRTVNRRSRLIALVGNQLVWDVKEPTHYSKRVGDVVPGVVV